MRDKLSMSQILCVNNFCINTKYQLISNLFFSFKNKIKLISNLILINITFLQVLAKRIHFIRFTYLNIFLLINFQSEDFFPHIL
jgi:hypothetical protein